MCSLTAKNYRGKINYHVLPYWDILDVCLCGCYSYF